MSPTAIGQTNDPAEPLKHSEAATILKGAEKARITLHSGFTTVRDVGVYRGLTDVALRDAIAAGEVEGPRMFVAGGYITIPGGGGAVTGRQAGNGHRPGIPHRRSARRPRRRGRACGQSSAAAPTSSS